MQVKSLFLTLLWLCCLIPLGYARALAQPSKQDNTTPLHFTKNISQITEQHIKVRTHIDAYISTGQGLNVFIGKGQIQYQWAQQTSHQPNELTYGGGSTLSLQENGSLCAITPIGSIGEHASWVYTQESRAIGSRFVFTLYSNSHV